jgi:hypothetical protein
MTTPQYDTNEYINGKLEEYAEIMQELEAIRAELPQLGELEKRADAVKAEIQKFAKDTDGDYSHAGYQVTLSIRESWDTKKLPGFAVAHPELNALKSTSAVATVRKMKG